MPVAAVTAGGRPSISSGSTSATCAPISGVPPTLNLIFRSWSVITAQSVTSLPVPAVVGTATSGGIRRSIGRMPVLVVLDRAAVHDLDPGRLRRVHRATAAERDEPVAALLPVERRCPADELNVGVRVDVVEEDCVLEDRKRALGEPRRRDALVGDEQRPRHSELAHELAQLRRSRRPVHDPRRYLDRANRLYLYRHPLSPPPRSEGRDPIAASVVAS